MQFGFSEDERICHELLAKYCRFHRTHDNNTTNGWWSEYEERGAWHAAGDRETLARVKSFLRTDAEEIHCLASNPSWNRG